MLRKTTPASSMQKTYDECYLICSTAIYFEGQNNEGEALRAWRNALDQIYYHNAYKIPSSYAPRTETEKALQDSLRSMELQCKERVDLLEALRKSRKEAEQEAKGGSDGPSNKSRESLGSVVNKPVNGEGTTWLGDNTVPQTSYSEIPRPSPALERRPVPPPRPSFGSTHSFVDESPRSASMVDSSASTLAPPSTLTPRTRTPSPEKKAGGMLKTLRSNPKDRSSSSRMSSSLRPRAPPAAAKAATQVWAGPQQKVSTGSASGAGPSSPNPSASTWDPYTRSLVERPATTEPSHRPSRPSYPTRKASEQSVVRPPSPSDYLTPHGNSSQDEMSKSRSSPLPYPDYPVLRPSAPPAYYSNSDESADTARPSPPPPPPHKQPPSPLVDKPQTVLPSLAQVGPSKISYMKEYPNHPPLKKAPPPAPLKRGERKPESDDPSSSRTAPSKPSPTVPRKAVGRAVGIVSATQERQKLDSSQAQLNRRVRADPQTSQTDDTNSSPERQSGRPGKRKVDLKSAPTKITPPSSEESPDEDGRSTPTAQEEWEIKKKEIMKNLPKGVDESAAKQIFNEIVIQGDEVHWDDVAGLEPAKSALKETVVYPFLRPDLFMGLREPARGMLLFGPPGTGKTMLARAVATESKSIFFAISASSLTSKYLGESEKLVRALFCLAKALAPSIIFVDEIDSILSARGGSSEHEATRRIKTEFLIQWSDLQKAAAGRETADGDATRVLVLAATNLPWAIDEAARRRFVRRQYIPLPEDWVREQQLRTLLAAQKHNLRDRDLKVLVRLTEGYSGSDITALAKDAAMGPLRSLGEKLLHMTPDEIRPIGLVDFEASLVNIRPSVSRQGLKEFEDWAREFGERGG